jgi:hypothetical protein
MTTPPDPDFIPNFLHTRPAEPAPNHIDFARGGFQAELERAAGALKIIDLRMETTLEKIEQLQRQQADDSREMAQLVIAQRAAKRALSELDGVVL